MEIPRWLIEEKREQKEQERLRKHLDKVLTGKKKMTFTQIVGKMRAEWKN